MDATIKKLLNDFWKTQPALNMPGMSTDKMGIRLGDIIEKALSDLSQNGLDAATKKTLNDFAKSQPAMNVPGKPAEKSGVKLGDILDSALKSGISVINSGIDTPFEATPVSGGTEIKIELVNHGLSAGMKIKITSGPSALLGTYTISETDDDWFKFLAPSGITDGIASWQAGPLVNAPVGLTAEEKKLLNQFYKSQPAMNIPGKPADKSGIPLGDLIALALG